MFEGVNASDGIGIGVAQVAVEPDLSFIPTAPSDAEDASESAGAHAAETPEPKRPRPSEIRAERNRRAEVMQRRTGKHSK